MNAEQWNAMYPVGTPVFAYPGIRPEHPVAIAFAKRAAEGRSFGDESPCKRLVTKTRTPAWELGHGEPVVSVDGYAGGIVLDHVDVVTEDKWRAAKEAEAMAVVTPKPGLSHAALAESVPALLATIKQLRDLRTPLVDALRTVHESMTSCAGDEWAEEWLGEVWSGLPLEVRALAGDQDATAEIAAAQGALPVPAGPHVTVTKAPDGGEDITFTTGGAL